MAASVQVQTEIEKPGVVLVQAVASVERDGDARPIAGFFVRRRYAGDKFLIAKPEEFSPRWMRFVDEPPKDWEPKLKKVIADLKVEDLMAEPPADPNRPFSMTDLQEQGRQSATMSYSNGRVVARKHA